MADSDNRALEGHRSRLRKRIYAADESLLDHELIEYLLGLHLRRRDTKPIAKKLLDQYGGLGRLLATDPDARGKRGTLAFTGASASLRGRAGFGAFNAAKGALRNLAMAMAKEHGADGIHVCHVVVDGAINGEKIRTAVPEYAEQLGEQGMIGLDALADAYAALHAQGPGGWSFELDLRTAVERW